MATAVRIVRGPQVSRSRTIHSRNFTSIPVIDVSALVSAKQDHQAAKLVGDQLHGACRDVGFFYVSNHGVPEGLCKRVLDEAASWYALPDNVKSQIALSPATCYRGYQPMGINVTHFDGLVSRDRHAAIDFFKEINQHSLQSGEVPPSPLHGLNLWPEQRPAFAAALREYKDHMTCLGSSLLQGIALGLGLPGCYFAGERAGSADAYWAMRVIHYPPNPHARKRTEAAGRQAAMQGNAPPQEVHESCGQHTDYGLLTLINQQQHVSALQVKNAKGEWIEAVPIPGTFVCNIGDMFKVWTNGLYQPTLHRVANNDPYNERISIPFFYDPGFKTTVEPLAEFCRDSAPRFQPIMYGEHLDRKILRNFDFKQTPKDTKDKM